MLTIAASASDPTPRAAAPERGVLFSGTDVVEGATYSYYGVIVALSHDLSRDGWALRLYGSRDDYDTNPGDGRGWQGDVMLGYNFTRGGMEGAIFVGVDYQNFKDDSGSPELQGTEFGAKVAAELETVAGSPVYIGLEGSYSTSFDSYWARARLGAHRHKLTFGPEVSVLGNVDFDAQRLGAFLTIHDLNPFRFRPFDLTISGGHQWVSDDSTSGAGGEEGFYGAVSFKTLF